MTDYVRLYVCPGMYVVESLPWMPSDIWIHDGNGAHHTDDVHAFANMVQALKHHAIPYYAARLSFVPSHIV